MSDGEEERRDDRERDEDNPRRGATMDDEDANAGGDRAGEDAGEARRAPPPPEGGAPPPSTDPRELPGVSVLVRNLSWDSREDDVRDRFAGYGNILDVYMPKDRETGRPRGLAFVKYATQSEADAAVDGGVGDFLGREIRCEIATQQRKSRDEMRSGGGSQRRDDRPYAPRSRGMCYDWKAGKCDRGDSCRFAHSEDAGDDRRGGYDDRRGGNDRGGYGDRRGGYDDRRGGYDDRRGGHDDRRGGYDDRRGGHDDRRGGGGYGDRPRGVCYDWQAGRCDRGASCRFAHEGEQRA